MQDERLRQVLHRIEMEVGKMRGRERLLSPVMVNRNLLVIEQ